MEPHVGGGTGFKAAGLTEVSLGAVTAGVEL